MKKVIIIVLIVVPFLMVNSQQLDNTALFDLINEETELAKETGQSCSLEEARTYQEVSFEQQLDYALNLHDTASVLHTEELAIEQIKKTTKNHPDEWLGFYWSAHLHGQVGRLYEDNDKFISYMKIAHAHLITARTLNSAPTHEDKSEFLVLESLLYGLSGYTLYNPRKGIDTDKKKAQEYRFRSLDLLQKAEEENPNNPRVHLQKGIKSVLNANYQEGIDTFNKALSLYDLYPSSNKLYPNWGKAWISVWMPRAQKLIENKSASN